LLVTGDVLKLTTEYFRLFIVGMWYHHARSV